MEGQKRAWLYSRISLWTGNNHERFRQRETLLRTADALGFRVVGMSQDIAEGSSRQRRGLMRMSRAVQEGKIDVIITERLCRLSTDADFLVSYIRFLKQRNIQIYLTAQNGFLHDIGNNAYVEV